MCSENQERESSESPMLKAFWRVAPSVLLSFFAICDALVFLRAIVFTLIGPSLTLIGPSRGGSFRVYHLLRAGNSPPDCKCMMAH